MIQQASISEEQENRDKAARMLMWLGIASMVIFFGGLTSAYIVRMNGGNWKNILLPYEFYISTALIMFSSVTMNTALMAVKNSKPAGLFMFLTLLLGFGFAVFQVLGWRDLHHSGIYFTGKLSIASGQYLYVLTWAHLMHLLFGLIALLFTAIKTVNGKYSAASYNGMKICSIFWHFLDILWIYLFLFLLFIRYIA